MYYIFAIIIALSFIAALIVIPFLIALMLVKQKRERIKKINEQKNIYMKQQNQNMYQYQNTYQYQNQKIDNYNYNNGQNNKYNENSNKILYQKKEIITDYEKKLYQIIKSIAFDKNLEIITKIRLADLIETTTNNKYDFYRIQSKHIDFALCNCDNLEPILLIELDDNTHNDNNRRIRDDFVNQSLVQSGYKILRVRKLDKELITEMINAILENNMPGVYYT